MCLAPDTQDPSYTCLWIPIQKNEVSEPILVCREFWMFLCWEVQPCVVLEVLGVFFFVFFLLGLCGFGGCGCGCSFGGWFHEVFALA